MEIWKPIRDFPCYNASSEGRIMNVRTQHILKPVIDEYGYSKVTLRKNGKQYCVRVHRLIADTFLGDSENLDVRAKNLDISNTRPDNLECCTRSETIMRAYERGSKAPSNRTRIRVIETGDIFESISECARELGCNKSSISKFLSGRLNDVKGYHFEVV